MKHQNSIQWAKRSLVALISAGMLAPVMAQDVGNRVAVVNSEKVFNESNLAKAMQTRLQNEFTKRQNELRDSAQKIKLAAEKLDRDAAVMSEAERIRRQRELADQDRELQRILARVGQWQLDGAGVIGGSGVARRLNEACDKRAPLRAVHEGPEHSARTSWRRQPNY